MAFKTLRIIRLRVIMFVLELNNYCMMFFLLFQSCCQSAALWKCFLLAICKSFKVLWNKKKHTWHHLQHLDLIDTDTLLISALTLPVLVLSFFIEMPRRCIPVRQSTAMSWASPRGHTSQTVSKEPVKDLPILCVPLTTFPSLAEAFTSALLSHSMSWLDIWPCTEPGLCVCSILTARPPEHGSFSVLCRGMK